VYDIGTIKKDIAEHLELVTKNVGTRKKKSFGFLERGFTR